MKLSLSTLRIVHVSEPYNTTDCTREVYILRETKSLVTPNVVKLGHNRTSNGNAQASVYLCAGAQVGELGYCLYCLIVNMECWSFSSSNILDLRFMPVCVETHNAG